MSEKKELNAQDLEQVAGGYGLGYASAENLPKDHGEHISEQEAVNYKGQEVYFVADMVDSLYGYGTLIDSDYGLKMDGYYAEHKIFVKYFSRPSNLAIETNQEKTIKSTEWTLYKKNN